MVLLLDILIIALIVVAIAVLIYLIFFLKKLGSNIELITQDVHELKERTEPILIQLEDTAAKANSIVEKAESHLNSLEETIENVQSRYQAFSEGIKTDNPFADFIKNISAVSKGINAFWKKYKD